MMARTRDNIRIALIQVRERDDVERQEQRCFVDRLGIPLSRIHAINLVRTPLIGWSDVADADAVLIGGAGIFSATQEYPFTRPLEALCRQLADARKPTFGACWGHQFLAAALGGTVITEPDHAETGTNTVELTQAGKADPLLGKLPSTFLANMGHKDCVSLLPPGAVELATSKGCPVQTFRMQDLPMYGTQFHSELDVEGLRERLKIYQREYAPDPQKYGRLIASLRDTPEVDRLLRWFLEVFVYEHE